MVADLSDFVDAPEEDTSPVKAKAPPSTTAATNLDDFVDPGVIERQKQDEQMRAALKTPDTDAEIVNRAMKEGKGITIVNGKPVPTAPPVEPPASVGERVMTGGLTSLATAAMKTGAGALRMMGKSNPLVDTTPLAEDLAGTAKLAEEQVPQDTASKIGSGVGSAVSLAAMGSLPTALAGMTLQSQAEKSSFGAALKAAPELAAYWLLGMGAGKAVAPFIKQSSPFIKTLAQGAAATAANIASSAAIRAANKQPLMPDAQSLAQDAVFGFGMHGMEAGKEAVKDKATVVAMLKHAPDDALRSAAADPDFRKSSPYDPKLIDEELGRRDAVTQKNVTASEMTRQAQETRAFVQPILQNLPGDTQQKVTDILAKQERGEPLTDGETAALNEVRSYATKHAELNAPVIRSEPPPTSPARGSAAIPPVSTGGPPVEPATVQAVAPLVQAADAAKDVLPAASAAAKEQAAAIIAKTREAVEAKRAAVVPEAQPPSPPPVTEPPALPPVDTLGDASQFSSENPRFIIKNGMVVDRFYSQSITHPATPLEDAKAVLQTLNESEFGKSDSRQVTLGRDESGDPIIVSGGATELKVKPSPPPAKVEPPSPGQAPMPIAGAEGTTAEAAPAAVEGAAGKPTGLSQEIVDGYVESNAEKPLADTLRFLIDNKVSDDQILRAVQSISPNFGRPELAKFKQDQPAPLVGPALLHEGEVVAKGEVGKIHDDLVKEGVPKDQDWTDAERGFHDQNGNFLNRLDAAKRALDTGMIDKDKYAEIIKGGKDNTAKAQEKLDAGKISQEEFDRQKALEGLHSEDLIEARDKAAKPEPVAEPAQEPEPKAEPSKPEPVKRAESVSKLLAMLDEEEPAAEAEAAPTPNEPTVEPKKPLSRAETITALQTELQQARKDKNTHAARDLDKRIKALRLEKTQRKPEEAPAPEPVAEPTKPEPTTPKELWQKTRGESIAEGGTATAHVLAVREAVKAGKQVPQEVLEEIGAPWAEKALKKLRKEQGYQVSDSALERALKALSDETDSINLYSDPFFYQTAIKPITRGALHLMEEAFNQGALAKAVMEDIVRYVSERVNVSEDRIRAFFKESVEDTAKLHGQTYEEPQTPPPTAEPASEPPPTEAAKPESAEPPPAEPPPTESPPAGEPPPPTGTGAEGRGGDDEETIGIRNAITEAKRSELGMDPREEVARKSFGTALDNAKARLDENPNAGKVLVSELERKVRPLTDDEDALLTLEQAHRQNEYDAAVESLHDAETQEDQAAARVRVAFARDNLFSVFSVAENAGTENARGLNARKILVRNDYSLAKIAADYREAANNNKSNGPLTKEQQAAVQKLYDDLKVERDKVTAAEAARDEERVKRLAAEAVAARLQAHAAETAKPESKTPKPAKPATPKAPLSKPILDFVDTKMAEVRARIAARRQKTFADPIGLNVAADFADHAILGGLHMIKLGTNFARWSRAMIADLGEEIKPKLRELHKAAKAQRDNLLSEAPRDFEAERNATVDGMKERIKGGDKLTDLGRYVTKLMDQFIAQGMQDRDMLIDAVHGVLKKEFDPEITRRQTMEALTNYGEWHALDKDPVKVIRRDVRGQTRQLLKIEDMEANKAPEKTGTEYPKPSDTERRLVKIVNEMKKKGGYVVTDPERQLRTALDAKTTRLKNEIADLDFQISTGKRIIKERAPSPENDETLALTKQRDEKRAQLKEILDADNTPMPEEQKALNDALVQREKWAQKLDDISTGKIDPKTAEGKASLTQLEEDVRLETEGMKQAAAELRKAGKPVKPEAEKQLAALQRQRDTLSKILSGGIDPKKPGETKLLSTEAENVQAEIHAMQELRAQQRREASQKTPEEIQARKVAALEKSAQKRLDETNKQLDDARKGIFDGKKEEPSKLTSDKLEAIKAARGEARTEIEWLKSLKDEKMSDEERATKAFIARRLGQYYDSLKRMAEGDLGPRPKKPAFDFTKNADAMEAEKLYREQQQRVRKTIEDIRQKNRSMSERIGDFVVKWNREAKLSSLTVIPKLIEAGLIRVVMDPVARIAGQPLRVIPGFSDKAPMELGLSAKAETKALAALWSPREVWRKLTKGKSTQDVLYGKEADMHEQRGFVGNLHGVVKEPVRQGIQARTEQLLIEKAGKEGIDLTEPAAQTAIKSAALEHANRGIFLGDNLVSRYMTGMVLRALRNAKEHPATARAFANALEFLMPVVKVTTNIGIHSMRLNPLVGFGETALRLTNALRKGELSNRAEGLSEEDAEVISRSFKAGVIGTVLAAYAWNNPGEFGGVVTEEDKKKNPKLKSGEIRTPGASHLPTWMQTMPAWMNHAPELNFLNTVASARRIFDQNYKRGDAWNSGLEALAFATMSPVKNLPFINTWVQLFGGHETYGQKAGAMVRDFAIPGAVTSTLRFTDKTPRNPKTFTDEVKMGIPWERGTVPERKDKKTPQPRQSAPSLNTSGAGLKMPRGPRGQNLIGAGGKF